ncbi:MAG: diacylglycerol kinase family protein [bacterium]
MIPIKIHIVLNPSSAAGNTGKHKDEILALLSRSFTFPMSVCITRAPLEATASVRAAIQDGAELIIAVGGDGTVQEVVNGFFIDGKMQKQVRLGVISSGTAQDVAKNLGLPRTLEQQIQVVAGEKDRAIDIGRVEYSDLTGNRIERFFINECQAGIAAVVVKRVLQKHKRFGGFLGFGLVAVSTLTTYHSHRVTVTVDDTPVPVDTVLGVVVANGNYAGGGMCFAPKARVDDGIFDVVIIHDMKTLSRLMNFPKIYLGKHINLPAITYRHGKHVTITSPEEVLVEADGELLGMLPITVDLIPSALMLKTSVIGSALHGDS